jgi:hypothetical protein
LSQQAAINPSPDSEEVFFDRVAGAVTPPGRGIAATAIRTRAAADAGKNLDGPPNRNVWLDFGIGCALDAASSYRSHNLSAVVGIRF